MFDLDSSLIVQSPKKELVAITSWASGFTVHRMIDSTWIEAPDCNVNVVDLFTCQVRSKVSPTAFIATVPAIVVSVAMSSPIYQLRLMSAIRHYPDIMLCADDSLLLALCADVFSTTELRERLNVIPHHFYAIDIAMRLLGATRVYAPAEDLFESISFKNIAEFRHCKRLLIDAAIKRGWEI